MFISIIVYLLMVFLIFWVYSGYVIMLYILIITGKRYEHKEEIEDYPYVSILVPCFNESSLAEEKVKNLLGLDYPKDKLEIIFLDGNSNDGTLELLQRNTANIKYIKIVQTGCQGKINQINYILPEIKSEIIVNTDMDTMLSKNILKELVNVFKTDKDISVVGANVIPESRLSFEREYWFLQNRIRFLESRAHSSSIVAAPCYAFRKGLIKTFPADCIADDIYISFYANTKGKKTKYVEKAIAYETRCPDRTMTLLQHKFRKGNAYIIELLRFVYLLAYMQPRWKFIFLTKFLQVVVIPWIIPFFIIGSISMILAGKALTSLVIFSFIFLFISSLIVHFILKRGRKESIGKVSHFPFSVFIITNAILLLDGLSFPFYRQTSSYDKVRS
ncbi:MAG: glycosyltransferase [Candidatus Omnitrophota bacterium]|nr:glycosyltransferase [Candidatus Omnitrophota bacterium]